MKNILKGSLFALIAGMAASQAAAADIAYAQPAPAPSLIGSDPIRTDEFSGFFVNLKAGSTFGNSQKFSGSVVDLYSAPGIGAATVGDFTGKIKAGSNFALSGGVGYDVNLGGIVIGAELNVGFEDRRSRRFDGVFSGASAVSTPLGTTAFAVAGPFGGSIRSGAAYDVNARLRAGYVVMPQLLAYGFVGMGMKSIEYKGASVKDDVVVPVASVGVGLEYAIGGGWFARGEYEYSKEFEHKIATRYSVADAFGGVNDGAGFAKTKSDQHKVMLGVGYRFR